MGSAEVSRGVFDGGFVCGTRLPEEAGNLVSHIGYVASRDILEELEISNDRAVVETMIEGMR